jgi:hypothetical protein
VTDLQNAALEGLLSRVQVIVAQTGLESDDAELLAAFGEPGDSADRLDPKREMRARIDALSDVVAERLPCSSTSRMPGGALLHRAIARATRRQDEALLEEIRGLASQIKERLLELTDSVPSSLTLSDRSTRGQIQVVADSVAAMEDRLAVTLSRIEEIEKRLDRVEHSQ